MKKRVSRSVKDDIQFPDGRYAQRVGLASHVIDEWIHEASTSRLHWDLLADVSIAHGGMLPDINQVLLPKKTDEVSEEPKSGAQEGC
ncbi:probable histone H2A.6 [Musa acuminata AAA Group]|uniref:probable histone H2A.6 n=1 Tax=Musa acuminata AAA Group TaxID=214697 RepID=UPI0031D8D031